MHNKIKTFLTNNIVPIFMILIILIIAPLSGLRFGYIVNEMIGRISRNLFLVLALLIPIIAGMGLNFAIVLGAMGGQIALIVISNWHILGLNGIFLAMIISIPISALLGYFGGKVLNRAKGREMITSMILGYFINGVYQLFVLYLMGPVIPIRDPKILLSSGRGVRNSINLNEIQGVLDKTFSLKIGIFSLPMLTFFVIFILCLFIIWFRKTKLGQDMRAVGEDIEVSRSAGIEVDKTRLISIVISTVLAGIGQIIYLQNLGTMNTYNSHEQIGMFSVAALLVGGASIARATIPNAISGVILFHLMFILAPRAGKVIMGSAQIGEYFRVFMSYGIIAVVLIMYEWRRRKHIESARKRERDLQLKKEADESE